MLDTSIVLTELPTIHRDLGFSDTGLALFTLASVAIGAAPSPGALALLAGFLCNERLAAQPIMPLRLFGNRQRFAAYGARMSLRPCGAAHR